MPDEEVPPMSSRLFSSGLIPLAVLLLAAWGVAPAPEPEAEPSYVVAQSGSAAFLQLPGSGASSGISWSSRGGPAGRTHLDSSVLPGPPTPLICSVDTTDAGTIPVCSTSATDNECSARCDSAEVCSAFFDPIGTANTAACSTLGGGGAKRCSVLLPPIGGFLVPSACSAELGGPLTRIVCSVITPGAGKVCSAENPPIGQANMCSTIPSGFVGGGAECSVINNAAAFTNFCSTGFPEAGGGLTKMCSTFQAGTECSMFALNDGSCTSLAGAPVGSCSVFAPGSNCSVIPTTGGPICTLP